MSAGWRAALLPLRAVADPEAALLETRVKPHALAAVSLAVLLSLLGALAIPRLLALLAVSLAPGRSALLDSHAAVLKTALTRYVVADRLLPPLPYVFAGAILAAIAAPALATRGVGAGKVAAVLAAGAAPVLIQRLGELGVVWLTPAQSLTSGDIVTLPARFNIGAAGLLTSLGVATGRWTSVAAEAANAVGIWVVALWGAGLASLERGETAAARGAALPVWPFAMAAGAYAAGYALYAALFPLLLVLLMGSP